MRRVVREGSILVGSRPPPIRKVPGFVSLLNNLYRRFEHLVHEFAKFGSIGAIAFVITIGIANALQFGLDLGPLKSNAAGTVIATTFAYAANRFWTFRHRDRAGLGREYVLFFALNAIGLVITNLFIGLTHYGLGQDGPIAYNAALIFGTAVATLFRFWSYKKWVFLPPGATPAPRPKVLVTTDDEYVTLAELFQPHPADLVSDHQRRLQTIA